MDTLLKVWAILGPLLVAAISAAWSRHTQKSDRDFQSKMEREKQQLQQALDQSSQKMARKADRINTLRKALIEFMSSSIEYVRKQSIQLTTPNPENLAAASAVNDRFINSNQMVILLGSAAVEGAAIDLWNATLAVAKNYSTPVDDDYLQKLKDYKLARSSFNRAAKEYLEQQDGDVA